jgi:arylsulfatase A-like enzyme
MKASLITAALALAVSAAAAQPRPNILIILADDMGYSDISCYGSEIPTPHIDRLAERGLRFTQFYNVARCCPSRACLLTGLYSAQAGIEHMVQDNHLPGYRGFLNDRCVTIAEALRQAGYFTAISGKWHVGSEPEHWPRQRGFDRFYGMPLGGGFYFKPTDRLVIAQDDSVLYDGERQPPAGWYTTDAYAHQAVAYVDEALAEKKPFFVYLAFNSPHWPLQAPAAEVARWRGKYLAGWDKLREERYEREIKLGIVDPSWGLSPRDSSNRPGHVRAWDSLTADEKNRFDAIMATYAAVVQHMDRDIGQVVESLQERGVLDNTLILFLSDNGGNAEGGPNGKLEGKDPGSADSVVWEGQSWATLSNTPFRYYKHYDFEGGISTPLIVQWPARIHSGGELRRQMGHIVDIMATCLDVAGAAYPTEYHGKPITPTEGVSIVPAFDNRPTGQDILYWEHEGNAALREGDWKLVRLGMHGKWELYDVKRDRTELHNLAGGNPGLVQRLAAQWQAWALRTHVLPAPGPGAEGYAKSYWTRP